MGAALIAWVLLLGITSTLGGGIDNRLAEGLPDVFFGWASRRPTWVETSGVPFAVGVWLMARTGRDQSRWWVVALATAGVVVGMGIALEVGLRLGDGGGLSDLATGLWEWWALWAVPGAVLAGAWAAWPRAMPERATVVAAAATGAAAGLLAAVSIYDGWDVPGGVAVGAAALVVLWLDRGVLRRHWLTAGLVVVAVMACAAWNWGVPSGLDPWSRSLGPIGS